ncbi:MAG: hypothetical protein IKC46_14040 [Lachnospiraceae bacterium]|nr:hypothetical protein [Lachnospiraceae bacterium]
MKGYITVYLALVTGILLSMFLTVIGASRRDLIRLQIECCTDMAMQSALAQYHQEMLSRYGLFFVDTSYGSGEPDYHKTEQMICSYLEKNLAPEQTFAVSGAGNLTGLSAESVELLQAGAATDENFGVLKYHVVQYMKDCYGISAAQGLLALGEQLAGSGYTGDGIEQEWDAAQAQLTEEIRSGKRLQDEEWDGNIPETPSDAVQATRGEGILSRVVKEKKLSSKAVSAQSLVSGRKRNQGTGLSAKKLVPDSVWENGLLYAYILEKCGYFGAEKENSALDYQVEYILHGQESDVENLRKTAQQLLWIREASNAAFLFSSSLKQPAETAALLITGILGLPELAELMTTVILFAWSYAESVKDVRILLSGGKVPLVKNQESWNTSFGQLLTYRAHLDDWKESENGMTYRDYLGGLLFLKGADKVMPGLADVMESDIRKTAGNEKFRMDGLIDSMQVMISVSSSYGGNWQITREYDYE